MEPDEEVYLPEDTVGSKRPKREAPLNDLQNQTGLHNKKSLFTANLALRSNAGDSHASSDALKWKGQTFGQTQVSEKANKQSTLFVTAPPEKAIDKKGLSTSEELQLKTGVKYAAVRKNKQEEPKENFELVDDVDLVDATDEQLDDGFATQPPLQIIDFHSSASQQPQINKLKQPNFGGGPIDNAGKVLFEATNRPAQAESSLAPSSSWKHFEQTDQQSEEELLSRPPPQILSSNLFPDVATADKAGASAPIELFKQGSFGKSKALLPSSGKLPTNPQSSSILFSATGAASKPEQPSQLKQAPKEPSQQPREGAAGTSLQTLPPRPAQPTLSRHSISLFGNAEIKDLKEPFIDNHAILKAMLSSNEQQTELSRKQLQRIIHNFSHYQPDPAKQTEYQQLCSNTYCMGLETFEADQSMRPRYRRIFEAVIYAVKTRYCCNSMAVIEVLRIFISQNLSQLAGSNNNFPWNRVQEVIEQAPPQLGVDYEINTKSDAFELFVKELGSLIKVQKVVLTHIFRTMHNRRSLMDLLRRQFPKTVAHLWQSLKLALDSCSDAVMHNNIELEEVLKVDIELILKCMQSIIQDEGRSHFADDLVCSFVNNVGRLVVEVPTFERKVLEIAVRLLNLDEVVDQLHQPKRVTQKMHIFKKKPELLDELRKSDIPMFREIAPIIDSGRLIATSTSTQVHELKGGFWIDWLELWLENRDIVVDSSLAHAGKLLTGVLNESAQMFWSAFESNHFSNIKRLIAKTYERKDTHFKTLMKMLEALLGRKNKTLVRETLLNLDKLLLGREVRRQSTLRQLSQTIVHIPMLGESFLQFILQVLILEPGQAALLEPSLDEQRGPFQYLVDAMCSAVPWKQPQTYVNLLWAVNRLLSDRSTFRSMIEAILESRFPQSKNNMYGGSRMPCFEFLFQTEDLFSSKTQLRVELFAALNEHLDLTLMLHETGHVLPLHEQQTNWLATLLEFLTLRENRAINLKDIYILLVHLLDIKDRNIMGIVRTALSKVNEQELFRYLLPTRNESPFGNLYINSAQASFMFRGGRSNQLNGLVDSLKILQQGLLLLSNQQFVAANYNDLPILGMIRDNLIQGVAQSSRERPHLLVILCNLIVLDKTSLYLMSYRHDDVSVLSLRVLNNALFLTTVKNRLNRILFQSKSFRRDVMLHGNDYSLKSLLFAAIEDKLKHQQSGHVDTLVLLALLVGKEPVLANEIFLAMQLRIETVLLQSLSIHHERLFEVGLGLLTTICSTTELRRMFDRLFKTAFYLEGLIKIGTVLYLKRPSHSILMPNLCYVLLKELPTNEIMDKVVAMNLSCLMSTEMVGRLLTGPNLPASTSKTNPSKSIMWTNDDVLLRLNQNRIAGLVPLNESVCSQLNYEYWCKLALVCLQSNLEERDHIALVVRPNTDNIHAAMKYLARELVRLSYPQPALAILAVAIDRLEDVDLAAYTLPLLRKLISSQDPSVDLTFNQKLLLLTIRRFLPPHLFDWQDDLDGLLLRTNNAELLLVSSLTEGMMQPVVSDSDMRLLLRYISESTSDRLDKAILPLVRLTASLQAGQQRNPIYLSQVVNFIQQVSGSTMPIYEGNQRSSLHIVWCWCLIVARQLVLSPQISKEVLDKIEAAVITRIEFFIVAREKSLVTSGPLAQSMSLSVVEELNLLVSAVLSLLSRTRMLGFAELLYKLTPLLASIPQPMQPYSDYESQIAELFASTDANNKRYSLLEFVSDCVTIQLVEMYLGVLLELFDNHQPIPLKVVSEFEVSLHSILEKPTSILYRTGLNKPIVENIVREPSKRYAELSKTIGFLDTAYQRHSYDTLIALSNCLIHSAVEVVIAYVKHQRKENQSVERLAQFCQCFYLSIQAMNNRYQSVFPQQFLDNLVKSLQEALYG